MELKKLGTVGLGFVAGIAFVVACPSPMEVATSVAEPAPGVAQPSGCKQWQVRDFSAGRLGGGKIQDVPPGWEPFGAAGSLYLLRRCVG